MIDELMFADGLVSEEDLAHYGVAKRSGRYPWGSGENPYHHGASSPFKRMRERREEKKKAKATAARVEKARQTKAAKAEYEKKKAEALKSGSAQEMAPYIKDLSNDQLRELKNRLQLESEFRQLVVKEKSELDPKIAARVAKLNQLNAYTDTGITTYNNVAKILNAFSGSELPIIGSKSAKEIRRKDIGDKEDLLKKIADRKKAEASERKEKAEADSAEYKRDRAKQLDERNDRQYEESRREKAKKKQEQGKPGKTKEEEKTYNFTSKKVDDIVEEIKDVEVVVRPVEKSSDRMIEDKNKKKKK